MSVSQGTERIIRPGEISAVYGEMTSAKLYGVIRSSAYAPGPGLSDAEPGWSRGTAAQTPETGGALRSDHADSVCEK